MGRLIDTNDIRVKPQYMQDVMGIAMIRCEDLSRILADVPTVEAIPKTDYENRLKADLKAILVDLQLEIHELENPYPHDNDNLLPLAQHNAFYDAKSTIEDLVDEKIKH